jgi:hypothetical protein
LTERYPYDPGAFARVWQRLWELVPAYYRVLDGGDRLIPAEAAAALVQGTLAGHDLARLLGALAAPLAAVRQSIEELHRDLFIDSAGDGAIPLLAEMVGTTLVFPDASSNRRDVRGTVGWRRRKGTPAMLEELVDELSGRMTPLLEGWQLLAITQDLDLLRLARTTIDLRDLRVAERTRGPLDATSHVADLRAPAETTGRYHPAHTSHWLHVTELFPVLRGEAAYRGDQGDPIAGTVLPPAAPPRDREWRYAVHPLGLPQPLRARRIGAGDDLRSDRIPAMHFAHAPGDYFGREGRFTIEVLGLPAGVGAARGEPADPLRSLADPAIFSGAHTFELLAGPRRIGDPVVLALVAVGLTGSPPRAGGAQAVIAQATLAAGALGPTANVAPAPAGPAAAMLRLTPASGTAAFFAGGTLLVTAGAGAPSIAARWLSPATGSVPDAGELSRRGQLRGAIAFEVPPAWIAGERWFYLGADGTLGEAQAGGEGPIAVALDPDGRIELAEVVRPGIGSAWPPLAHGADREPTRALVPAPGTGPVRVHGGPVLADSGGALVAAPELDARIVFAIATTEATTTFAPIGALTVGAPAAADRGRWSIVDAAGAPVATAAAALARLAQLAELVASSREGTQRLVARFEVAAPRGTLPPCEVTWPAATGDVLLAHLPELAADPPPLAGWPAPAGWSASYHVWFGVDGSAWNGDALARYACGSVAPLGPPDTGPVLHRRRRVRWRNLCPWRSEDPAAARRLDPTPAGCLDVDVEHGLFALALGEPPPVAPGDRVPNVTVSYQQGATAHVGALPAERATLLRRLPEPATRIVSRAGIAGSGPLPVTLAIPRYPTLTAALAAIDADPARAATEVIELADSATYAAEAPRWPGKRAGDRRATRTLIIRAAEGARPVIRLTGWTSAIPGAGFERIVLRGLTLHAESALALAPPMIDPAAGPAADPEQARATFALELSTIATPWLSIAIAAPPRGVRVAVRRAITGPLLLTGDGELAITESIVDPGDRAAAAIVAREGAASVDRCTVMGTTEVGILEGSESIFRGVTTVLDRFRGCIRFSRVELGSVLPARHRVVPELDAASPAAIEPRFVSIDRQDPAYARLAESCDPAIRFGAADGAELGAFHDELWPVRREAVLRRLTEYTPAGLTPGLIRMD